MRFLFAAACDAVNLTENERCKTATLIGCCCYCCWWWKYWLHTYCYYRLKWMLPMLTSFLLFLLFEYWFCRYWRQSNCYCCFNLDVAAADVLPVGSTVWILMLLLLTSFLLLMLSSNMYVVVAYVIHVAVVEKLIMPMLTSSLFGCWCLCCFWIPMLTFHTIYLWSPGSSENGLSF